jgi:Cdc6-like AAA superfamily ATPase
MSVEFFRFDVSYKFLHFFIIVIVVLDNVDDLITRDKCQEVVEIILKIACWQ